MKSNEKIREELIATINNQIKNNDPPETKITYNRLRKEGYDDYQSKQMIAQCLAVEIFEIIKFKKPYNKNKYIKNLNLLPNEPFE